MKASREVWKLPLYKDISVGIRIAAPRRRLHRSAGIRRFDRKETAARTASRPSGYPATARCAGSQHFEAEHRGTSPRHRSKATKA